MGNASDITNELDPIWKALSDPTRREILDLLRDGPRTTTDLVDSFPRLSRFGVMKHIDVLRESGLVQTHEVGRKRINSLNAVPIRRIYERWVSRFQELWSSELLRIQEMAEKQEMAGKDDTAGKKRPQPRRKKNRGS